MADAGGIQDAPRDDADKDQVIAALRIALEARDTFAAIAAHEMRNPMTPVLLQVSGLRRAVQDPGRCRPEVLAPRLDILEHAVREFVRRSTAVLEASRVAAGQMRMDPTPLDLSDLVHAVVDRARPAARMAGCPIETAVQPGVTGAWDRPALEQVAESLVSNAIKFGAGQPVAVHLAADAQAVRIAVHDRGHGMAEVDRLRIFGRFERAVTQRDHGGLGIGLWLANRLVGAMGGGIAVTSDPGQGTRVEVTLPPGGHHQQGNDAA